MILPKRVLVGDQDPIAGAEVPAGSDVWITAVWALPKVCGEALPFEPQALPEGLRAVPLSGSGDRGGKDPRLSDALLNYRAGRNRYIDLIRSRGSALQEGRALTVLGRPATIGRRDGIPTVSFVARGCRLSLEAHGLVQPALLSFARGLEFISP